MQATYMFRGRIDGFLPSQFEADCGDTAVFLASAPSIAVFLVPSQSSVRNFNLNLSLKTSTAKQDARSILIGLSVVLHESIFMGLASALAKT